MGYAILRAKKLKSFAAVARSARHTHREMPTPNADPLQTRNNVTQGAKGADQVLAALERSLPAKRRKDAVLAVEYLVTASPESFKRHGGNLGDKSAYFSDALAWLKERHGAENVLSSTLHLDETTPHLVVYVVPKTKDGRLSAREFLGGPQKLRDMQDSFYAACNPKLGLERGIQGSKAKHEDVKAFYATMTADNKAPKLTPKDYAMAAVGKPTENWKKAEAVTRAREEASKAMTAAAREPHTRKANKSRRKALEKTAAKLDQAGQQQAHKRLLLDEQQGKLDSLEKYLEAERREVAKERDKVLELEAVNAALERRLEMLQAPAKAPETLTPSGPRRGHESGHTLG